MNILKKIFILFLIPITFFNPAFAIDWYKVNELPEVERANVEKTLELLNNTNPKPKDHKTISDYPNALQPTSWKIRFYIFCNAEINKCGLYDIKKNRFTGYKYNQYMEINSETNKIDLWRRNTNEIDTITFSDVPIVIENGKRISVQPVKRVAISVAKGTGFGILLIAGSPFLLVGFVGWCILGLFVGHHFIE